jgi:hypothetical protein
MRRTASQVIHQLEGRIARLERQSAKSAEDIIKDIISGLQSSGPENLLNGSKIGADLDGFLSVEADTAPAKAVEAFKVNVRKEMDKLERALKKHV